MPRKLVSREIKHTALKLNTKGVTLKDTAQAFGISVKTITRAEKKLEISGDIEGGRKTRGPKAKVTPEMIMVNRCVCAAIHDCSDSI
jgi:transposase